ncbi:NADH dehydrogenase subunit 4 (mitochondrion) [Debaryomyces hansenii]|uniref:NADH-ubiquinone oxidoreductase chain 4 n=1 Tax=Debaryomyces hansenii (strain ATCC 36239 / CBS 767 / BCRC 21394 / JCM 1990 / NBRC 0083 / IGC 2968) TaxID=284592 RepID=NU4M_DEBHA|nr:NADH dehydrogenase subunit 4 [Debaryomyces hansenii]A9RAH8.1 RecName: Full=NADH-ubiquinone oxidoreductase chain 4; AltName: Full=NADH dehydrogenase subunit 4 [Debaryomyces hansenii CBS767]ABF58079.1 NADH dehydrogenase subunit 4 [Debaryomyces hansenii]|eukprot:YP_001621430.1 NADH dehydrogenase subunit 4 (mitochondrion) [Debaryomyces hansenii]
MTMLFVIFSGLTSMTSRLVNSMSKHMFTVASMLMAMPTLYDWEEIDVYYTSDGMADVLMLLTMYMLPLSMISNWNNMKSTLYFELVLNLGMMLLINFMCQDMTSFYMYFEASLAPLFMLMGLYGAANRDKAADYVLMYTLFSSLFMLLAMALYEVMLDNTDYQATSLLVLSLDLQCMLFLAMSMGIAVKTPLAPLHTWLPVVHSESPLAGSMLLAGMILKLAVFAMIRLILPTLSDASVTYTPFVYVMCVMTMMYTSIITLRQTDLKVIIAYSSISHMAVCMLGMLSNTMTGITGSLVLCIAHGFVSPGLFMMVGGMLYDRYHNRLMYYFQGLISYMPYLSVYFMMLSFCNMGTPLSINFIGEMLSLTGAINRAPVLGAMAALSVLLSACYQMKLTNRLTGGIKTPYMSLTSDCTYRETVLMITLIVPTMFLGFFPSWVMDFLWDAPNLLYMFMVYRTFIKMSIPWL